MIYRTVRERLLASTIIAGAFIATTPVLAQDATPTTTGSSSQAPTGPQSAASTPVDENSQGEVVVTGSLIRNPNLTLQSPVNVTTRSEIELRQANVADDLLKELPGVTPSVGSSVNNGNNGASFVDLRGLGPSRNLVLLDGDRIVPTATIASTAFVDLNNIPLALIQRVDVLTGGASATYGADAIAGVVNFITRKDFAGVELEASNQITGRGDGMAKRFDLTLGSNFDGGKGNVVFSIGYQKSDPVFQGDRSFSQVALDHADPTNKALQGSLTATPASFTVPNYIPRVNQPQLSPDGTALVAPYAPYNFNPFNIFQTPFQRYNMYGAGNYEISDAIEVYGRGLFSRNTVNTIVAPSGIFNQTVTIPVSNPYLPASLRAVFCAHNDFDPNTAGIQTLTPAQCAAAAAATDPNDPNYRTFTTGVRRRTPEIGNRVSDYTSTTFDYKVGIRGNINSHIRWDISGGYGHSENIQTLGGYADVTRARQALLATNTSSCLDGSAGCVPLNLFGQTGSITPAMAQFLQVQSTTTNRAGLYQARGSLTGDIGWSSPFANSPIQFALGAEYRKYHASQNADLLSQNPGELGGTGAAVLPFSGGYNVREAFGEINLPLVQDKPLFQDLTLHGNVRRSHYEVQAPNNPRFNATTYGGGATWEPVSSFTLRGNYSHAVRAPNISELFAPKNTSLTNLATDPCAGTAPVNNANLRAICLAQGAPAYTIGTIQNPAAGQPNITTGGNTNLRPEIARTITLGGVFRPVFLPGFSATADYYNINVKHAITTPTPGDIINSCFGANPANPSATAAGTAACTGIRRDPNTGGLDGDAATTPGLFGVLSNLGNIHTHGVDATLDYRRDIGFAKLDLSFEGNYTATNRFQATPTSVDRECVGYYSVNCASPIPKFQWTQRTTLSFDKVDLSLLWRHINKLKYEPSALQNEIAGAQSDPDDCPDPTGADAGGCVTDPAFRHIKSFNYFDLSTRIMAGEHLTFTFTVQNLFDKKPPIVSYNIGSTSFNSGNTYPASYDTLGRRFAVTAKLDF